jgi:hydrogenase expression/formation protein HypE
LSGSLGEHAIALLSKRFDYRTSIKSDSNPLIKEVESIRKYVKIAKDPTRGGLASALNEMSQLHRIGFQIYDEDIPIKNEVKKVCEMLGLNPLELACEGRLICVVSEKNAKKAVSALKKHCRDAEVIGEAVLGEGVLLKTPLGSRIVPPPRGEIVPRIC